MFEMKSIRNISDTRRNDRKRNPLIRERSRCELNVMKRAEKNVLK